MEGPLLARTRTWGYFWGGNYNYINDPFVWSFYHDDEKDDHKKTPDYAMPWDNQFKPLKILSQYGK